MLIQNNPPLKTNTEKLFYFYSQNSMLFYKNYSLFRVRRTVKHFILKQTLL